MRNKQYTQDEISNATALIGQMAERWPKCFAIFERRRKPLKLGIHNDIDVAVTPEELGLALRLYVSNPRYLRSMRAGADRIDLDGNPAGTVTESEAAAAAHQLARRVARKARMVTVKTVTEPNLAETVESEPQGPATPTPTIKRIGLADLPEAARLRKQKASQQEASCK
jgi:ProP effector